MSDKEKINENEVLQNEVKENGEKDEALEKAREACSTAATTCTAYNNIKCHCLFVSEFLLKYAGTTWEPVLI